MIDGRTFPSVCLVEDSNGMRLLVVEDLERVPAGEAWIRGHSSGARILVAPVPGGWRAILAERFMEVRTERASQGIYIVPEGEGRVFDHFPSYLDLVTEETPEKAGGFVHLHAHSEFSALDGLSTIDGMVEAVAADDQPALAVTDHGVCAAHPVLQSAAKDKGIKPIFGIEANLVNDRHDQTPEKRYDYWHLILWAQTDEGLRNLWAMSTQANREGFYGRPRMDWETVERYAEGVMASTACLRGPVSQAILDEDETLARQMLARLLAIFGDRLYVELQTNQMEEQYRVNEALVGLAREQGIPFFVASDSHYSTVEDRLHHKVWIAAQTNKDLQDDADLFVGDSDYHLMTEAEVRQSLAYLGESVVDEAVANTLTVAERCQARMEGKTSPPVFSKAASEAEAIDKDVDRLIKLCLSNWHLTEGKTHPQAVYEERFEREMRLLIDKGFCGYYLMVADYTRWAKEHGILVGPGRGSGSGSLVAYLSEITGIDPVEADLMFERFLTEGRKALPDFDVDFPASKRQELTEYIVERYGEENVVRVGTHIRLKNKGVVRDMFRVLSKSLDNYHHPDIDKITAIIDEAEADKAGLGMSWEDLWDEHEEVLQPWRDKYPLVFDHADKLVGRLKTYGKHAAGLVIAPDASLTENLPLRKPSKDDPDLVAEFDMEELEKLGLVKFDILTLRTLDSIQECVDLIRKERGDDIDVYSWTIEYDDPQVWTEVADGHTLGIFQIETSTGTREVKRFRPMSLDELADVITLMRPGPMRSGLTETYFRRKFGQEEVTYLDPRLEPILSKTYGAMIYQEQVMKTCMVLAGYDETEADVVRKLLGKKQIEKVEEAGKQFNARAVEHGTDPEVARVIWEQMAEFAKYSFNRSHAYGYAMLGYWSAWLKVHYPLQFFTAWFSTVDKGRIPDFITEARRLGYRVLPPDINLSGRGFTAGQLEVRYGFDGVKGIGDAAVDALMEGQPYTSWDDFMERKGAKANMGVVKLLAQLGAFDSIEPRRKALVDRLEWETDGSADWCQHKDESVVKPHGLPCTFDWDAEPAPVSEKTGRKLKKKPPPKRCTKACRNFTAPVFISTDREYTPDEIMEIERELLGMYLTHTPFDRVPEELWDQRYTAELLGTPILKGSTVVDADLGDYLTIATVARLKPHTAKNGKKMGFLAINAVDADIDVTVFNTQWKEYEKDIEVGGLYIFQLHKNERGFSLLHLQPI